MVRVSEPWLLVFGMNSASQMFVDFGILQEGRTFPANVNVALCVRSEVRVLEDNVTLL
ncbi:Hypothetical protein SMAX5B_011749 [Scophthalmus maximus]|uniref:Uncharacterized protein n=1 Tax=Scophthalmus maximus TaxID=52904 RepID=A0A2U9AZI3_SCOMX|nr:Hypothetical protein SMAX5B_011749 [Scophthalmus maximus]